MPSSRLIIDCQALEDNFHRIQKQCGKAIMPMVKGNGYGLGGFEMASFYDGLGVPFVGVSYADEAIALREKGYRSPILAFSCPDPKPVFDHQITVALNSLEEAQRLHSEGEKRAQSVAIHLQLDLGLCRFGFTVDEAFAALPFIKKSRWLRLEGLMSHFGNDYAKEAAAFEGFAQAIRPKWIHMESSKSLALALPSCNLVRLGLALLPRLTLETQVVAVRTCPEGALVGYIGESAMCTRRLAILSIGYHDGLHLIYSGKGHVYIGGQKAPYVSNIYMDFLTVDVTGLKVDVGDSAEIFGPHIPLEEVAAWGKTNPRQLLCCLGPRVKRDYVNVRESVEAGKAHCAV